MKINARLSGETNDSHYLPIKSIIDSNAITIFQGNDPINHNTMDYFDLTIHELAHSTQAKVWGYDKILGKFVSNRKFLETWAVGVAWHITTLEYENYLGRNPSANYPNLVIDLVDGIEINRGFEFTEGDLVSNFNLETLEILYYRSNNWENFNENCQAFRPQNQTSNNINSIFQLWKEFN